MAQLHSIACIPDTLLLRRIHGLHNHCRRDALATAIDPPFTLVQPEP